MSKNAFLVWNGGKIVSCEMRFRMDGYRQG